MADHLSSEASHSNTWLTDELGLSEIAAAVLPGLFGLLVVVLVVIVALW